MRISRDIFKKYDIRGVVGDNLNPRDALLIGKAFGTYAAKKGVKRVSVGHDNRLSSEHLYAQFVEGLLSTGATVYELGPTLTPIVHFTAYEMSMPATAMVTASHSPVRYNGFKMTVKRSLIFDTELQKLYQLIRNGSFTKGAGTRKPKPVNEQYYRYILNNITLKRELKVILDCGNGTPSILAPQLLMDMGCSLKIFHCISDGSFPHHDPYPQKIAAYKQLVAAVKKEKADIGIAFDGDGDRMGIFDEHGNFIENDKIIYIHAKEILKKHKKASFVVNVAVSQAVIDAIERLGGSVSIWKTGPPYMIAKMRETKALLGGEISGHLAFADRFPGFDDGIYVAARTLELLASSNKPISSYLADLPAVFSTPEFRIFAGSKKFSAVENIEKKLKNDSSYDLNTADGLRVKADDGWFLIRTSQTEPLVTGRVEGYSKKSKERLQQLVTDLLKDEGVELDWKHPIAKH